MGAVAGFAPPDNASRKKGVQPLQAGKGHSFFWRKLHSLTGIVPIGAFLVEHIISNWEIVNGPLAYAQQVKFLNALPLVRVLEWVFIFIPLAYHAGYGMFIWWRGRSNVNVYPWAGNWAYYAQRVTGIIALAYIIQHVWRQRFSRHLASPNTPALAFAKVQHELIQPLDVRHLRHRHDRHLLALRLRRAGSSAPSGASRPALQARRKKSGYAWGGRRCRPLRLWDFISMYCRRLRNTPTPPPTSCPPNPPASSSTRPNHSPPGTTNPTQPGEVR